MLIVKLTTPIEKIKISMTHARTKEINEIFHLVSLHITAFLNINIPKANNHDTNWNVIKIESFTLKKQMGIYNITSYNIKME